MEPSSRKFLLELLPYLLNVKDTTNVLQLAKFVFENQSKIKDVYAELNKPVACCFYDGQPLSDPDVYEKVPCGKNVDGSFRFYPYKFCDFACGLAFLETNHCAPHMIVWLVLYAKRDRGLKCDIKRAPERALLNPYRVIPDGIELISFRTFSESHRYVEKQPHLPINPQIWADEEQKNTDVAFAIVIRDQQTLAKKLYKDWQDEGKVIPKTLLDARKADATKKANKGLLFSHSPC